MNKDIKQAAERYTEAIMKRIEASHLKDDAELAEKSARQLEISTWEELRALREQAMEPKV